MDDDRNRATSARCEDCIMHRPKLYRVGRNWRFASRASSGVATHPSDEPRAVVQVYAARAWSWQGIIADHTWIATKQVGAEFYVVHEVVKWDSGVGAQRDGFYERSITATPDRQWFSAPARLLYDMRLYDDSLVNRITRLCDLYPHRHVYRAWPGPNSNTFTAHIIKSAAEIHCELPARAIGKNFVL